MAKQPHNHDPYGPTYSAPKPAPKGIPVLLMRCGMESPDCQLKMGYVLRLDQITFGKDVLTALKREGMRLLVPKDNGTLFRSLPLDDFLPGRPQLVAVVCEACAQRALAADMTAGEIT
jgi:hypothetical protein